MRLQNNCTRASVISEKSKLQYEEVYERLLNWLRKCEGSRNTHSECDHCSWILNKRAGVATEFLTVAGKGTDMDGRM